MGLPQNLWVKTRHLGDAAISLTSNTTSNSAQEAKKSRRLSRRIEAELIAHIGEELGPERVERVVTPALGNPAKVEPLAPAAKASRENHHQS